MLLVDITDLYVGRMTSSFTRVTGEGASHADSLCLSIKAGERTLDLAMPTTSTRDLWASSVARLLRAMNIACRVHLSITTSIDSTSELSVKAQSTLTLASDPTNTTGTVGQPVTAADLQQKIGTIKFLESIVQQKEAEILQLKAGSSGSMTPFGQQSLDLAEKVRHLEEQAAIQNERAYTRSTLPRRRSDAAGDGVE